MNRIGGRYLANEGEGAPSDPSIHIFPLAHENSGEKDVVEFGVFILIVYIYVQSEYLNFKDDSKRVVLFFSTVYSFYRSELVIYDKPSR